MTTDAHDPELEGFIERNQARIGTGEQAIAFAMEIDDHFDMRAFLADWQTGLVANLDEYEDYREWLREQEKAA